jgi:hypothetical protein
MQGSPLGFDPEPEIVIHQTAFISAVEAVQTT